MTPAQAATLFALAGGITLGIAQISATNFWAKKQDFSTKDLALILTPLLIGGIAVAGISYYYKPTA